MRLQISPLRAACLVAALSLVACGSSSLDDNRFPTGSQTITTSSDYSRVYVTNVDAGTVSTMTTAGELLSAVDVGISPTRLARVGNKVLVTLRGERSVAVLHETAEGLSWTLSRWVQSRTASSQKTDPAFVALSQQDQVVELDMDTLMVSRTFDVPDQPAFLALHPSGNALYVGSLIHDVYACILERSGPSTPSCRKRTF